MRRIKNLMGVAANVFDTMKLLGLAAIIGRASVDMPIPGWMASEESFDDDSRLFKECYDRYLADNKRSDYRYFCIRFDDREIEHILNGNVFIRKTMITVHSNFSDMEIVDVAPEGMFIRVPVWRAHALAQVTLKNALTSLLIEFKDRNGKKRYYYDSLKTLDLTKHFQTVPCQLVNKGYLSTEQYRNNRLILNASLVNLINKTQEKIPHDHKLRISRK